MTAGKKGQWPTAQTSFARTPTCTALVACDGANLISERIEAGICGKCAKALAKKDKEPKPLKGVKVLR